MGTRLVVQLDVHPAAVAAPQAERADAADGKALQQGEGAAARLGLVLVLGRAGGPLPPLVVLLEQVERLPGRQDGQRFPGVPWKTATFRRVSRSPGGGALVLLRRDSGFRGRLQVHLLQPRDNSLRWGGRPISLSYWKQFFSFAVSLPNRSFSFENIPSLNIFST